MCITAYSFHEGCEFNGLKRESAHRINHVACVHPHLFEILREQVNEPKFTLI